MQSCAVLGHHNKMAQTLSEKQQEREGATNIEHELQTWVKYIISFHCNMHHAREF